MLLAKATIEFPPTIIGAINETRLSKGLSLAAINDTTPEGSSNVKLRCSVETGFTELKIC